MWMIYMQKLCNKQAGLQFQDILGQTLVVGLSLVHT